MLTPNNVDDTAQILAAIANLSQGGTVELGFGQFRISSEISVALPNIKIRGQGGCNTGNGRIPPTSIIYVGPEHGQMIGFVNTESCELSGVTLLGNGLADYCLVLYGCENSDFDVYMNGSLYAACAVMASPQRDSAWNHFHRLDVDGRNIAGGPSAPRSQYCLLLDGNGPFNACHNSFEFPNLWYAETASLSIGDADNNQFNGLLCGDEPTVQTQYGVLITDPNKARSNYFFHLQAGGTVGMRINNAKLPAVAVNMNRVQGYDQNNGETLPQTDTGAPYTGFLIFSL